MDGQMLGACGPDLFLIRSQRKSMAAFEPFKGEIAKAFYGDEPAETGGVLRRGDDFALPNIGDFKPVESVDVLKQQSPVSRQGRRTNRFGKRDKCYNLMSGLDVHAGGQLA